MALDSTEHLTSEPIVGGRRFVLPRRRLSAARHAGWALVAMGLLATIFMIFWIAGPVSTGFRTLAEDGDRAGLLSIVFGLLGVIGLVPSLGVLLAGATVLGDRSRCVVEVRDGILRVREKLILCGWSWKRRVDLIRELVLHPLKRGTSTAPHRAPPSAGAPELGHGIVARGPDMKDLVFAPGYPKELLEELASELARLIEAEAILPDLGEGVLPTETTRARPVTVEVAAADGPDRRATGVRARPTDSDVTVERTPDGITITVPPAGVWKGSKGLMVFAILWNLIMGGAGLLILLAHLGIVGAETHRYALLFLLPFFAVGIALLVAAFNMGRRHAVLGTIGKRLIIVRQSIFRRRQHQWDADEVAAIHCGPSGMKVNNVPVVEIQIHPRSGGKVGLLGQRPDRELEWIAGELNQALGLTAVNEDASGATTA